MWTSRRIRRGADGCDAAGAQWVRGLRLARHRRPVRAPGRVVRPHSLELAPVRVGWRFGRLLEPFPRLPVQARALMVVDHHRVVGKPVPHPHLQIAAHLAEANILRDDIVRDVHRAEGLGRRGVGLGNLHVMRAMRRQLRRAPVEQRQVVLHGHLEQIARLPLPVTLRGEEGLAHADDVVDAQLFAPMQQLHYILFSHLPINASNTEEETEELFEGLGVPIQAELVAFGLGREQRLPNLRGHRQSRPRQFEALAADDEHDQAADCPPPL
mmetsp:Transcript_62780/g.182057  ORF Transcript_62780/g.182057 Transcript_62780/m.182057 type:complete len:269 (+) Transcript_62780:170-976(+)